MSFGSPAPDAVQPDSFEFTLENLTTAQKIIDRYPPGRQASAVMPLLDIAQRQHDNWLPRAAMDYVADMLEMPPIRVYEVASFYTMYNKAPVGKHFLQVCTTTPCWLRGSSDIMQAIKDEAGIGNGQTSDDGDFTCLEVECLGACVNAPMVQINDDYFEDLDYDRMTGLIEKLKDGEDISVGSQTGRSGSEAEAGATSLKKLKPKTRGK
ncbi:MAG: NADH-quinone oxidoreductase subunit NuoE [Pseudomonadota bacterium]